ncbi:MAG: hypothetical protein PHP50_09635 [Lachnospiraceae bacterium]|nr:hypothetical protein [Lachnospiraceae bacterium]
MLRKLLFNLQLFADGGGDGGDGGSADAAGEATGVNVSGEEIPASIPEKAKNTYKKAMEKIKPAAPEPEQLEQTTTEPKTEEERKTYADLIKSDEYREEHKAYMEKTIGERLKKYKGIEDQYGKAKEALEIVASKYGVNPTEENFLDDLKEKIEADDSYYEKYATEHDVSTAEARRIVTMERKVSQLDAEKKNQEKQELIRQQISAIRQSAEKTKAQFPQFDLEKEMQDERFRKLCFTNNGDTSSAYMACHWQDVIPATVQMASRQVKQQTVNAIAANKARPIENGIVSGAPSVVTQDFSKMNLKELRAFAEEQRRKQNGR